MTRYDLAITLLLLLGAALAALVYWRLHESRPRVLRRARAKQMLAYKEALRAKAGGA